MLRRRKERKKEIQWRYLNTDGKKQGRRGKYRDIIHPLPPEETEGLSGNSGTMPTFGLASTATGVPAACGITLHALGRSPCLHTAAPAPPMPQLSLSAFNLGPTCAYPPPTCRNISHPSVCCTGGSCFFDFLILLFLLLSGKNGVARG